MVSVQALSIPDDTLVKDEIEFWNLSRNSTRVPVIRHVYYKEIRGGHWAPDLEEENGNTQKKRYRSSEKNIYIVSTLPYIRMEL